MTNIVTLTSQIEIPDHVSPWKLSFNPYITSNAILVDRNHRVYLVDDDTLIYLHQLTDEHLIQSDLARQVFIDWDASPFLYTIADNHRGSCLLFDLRVRNEPLKELLTIASQHNYLAKKEILHGYQTSLVNPYQHVFITDYAVTIIDSRMANRPVSDNYR
jgi:hypothetical protein